MKRKKLFIGIIIILVVGSLGIMIINKIDNKKATDTNKNTEKAVKSDTIPDDYIAIFNGGSGEVTYSTYVYKVDNGQANMGFKYINTVNTTVSYGSSEWSTKIKNQGEVTWTDDVFEVAKKHGAYSYVKLPNNDKTYTIEEYMGMFIMN